MRFIKAFILRLYIDPEVPDLLCGDLQIPADRKIFSFKNEAALIGLLHQLGVLTAQNTNSNPRRSIHEIENSD
jgi:hypothetical protein